MTFAASGITHDCDMNEPLLAAAKAAGVPVATGCTFGVCGTCKTRKLEGTVHMVHNGGITDEDIGEGYILVCCSQPRGDVVLDI